MKYWLCVTNEENWPIIKEKLVWGVPEKRKNLIARVKPGDILVIYVKPKRIGGIFRAASEPYESHELIFKWGEHGKEESFPNRIKIDPVTIPQSPIDISMIIPKLTFARGKKQWSAPLRMGMVEISEADYKIIKDHLQNLG